MNTIKFNEHTYDVESFNKNTYFNDNNVTSSASCSIKTNDITSLHALAAEGVSSLQIYHDGTLIYNLSDISGRLNSIDEYLSDDHVNINLSFTFNTVVLAEEEETPAGE